MTEFYRTFFPGLQTEGDNILVFDDFDGEYKALTYGAAFRDLSDEAVFEISGEDTVDFLHRISTAQISGIKPDEAVYTVFTNEKGRMIDRALFVNSSVQKLLISGRHYRQKLFSWINKYIISEDIALKSADRYFLYELSGQQAESFLILVFGSAPEKPGMVTKAELEGIFFSLVCVDDLGIKKFIIIGDRRYSTNLFEYMWNNKMIFDFRPVGSLAYDAFRIEKGIPVSPNEINDSYNPNDSKLIENVSFTKGCYIGQEVIARLDAYGKTQRMLCGMVLPEGVDIATGQLPVKLNDEDAGETGVITSAAFSPYMKKNIGMGYIKKSLFEEGREIKLKNSSTGVEISLKLLSLPLKK